MLWVEGEISNLVTPRSGHLYFSLKDPHAQVRCALFRGKRQLLRFKPGNGEQVLVRARIGFFEPRGDFQLLIEHMEPAGDGAAQRQFEQLKQKLQAAGLFAPERKLPLPAFPKKLGVITSATGAAVHDVLKVLRHRYPLLQVLIYPSAVQGKDAADELNKALQTALSQRLCDILLLTRGGGSLEDLAAFNDEQLARNIAAADIPIVSAVGHEVDFSIADFVADRRAPTPSAAAELISPDQASLRLQLGQLDKRLQQQLAQQLQIVQTRLQHLQLRLQRQHPGLHLQQQQQKLDEFDTRLARVMRQRQLQLQQRLLGQQKQLQAFNPVRQISRFQEKLTQLPLRLLGAWRVQQRLRQQQASALARELQAVSPLATLDRGYAIARVQKNSKVISSVKDLNKADIMETLVQDGRILSRIESIEKN